MPPRRRWGSAPRRVERMTWHEAMDRFGDRQARPALRRWSCVDLSAVFDGTEVKAFAAPCVKALLVPGGAALGRNRLDGLVDRAKELGAKGLAWFKVTLGRRRWRSTSPLDRFLSDAERAGAGAGDRGRAPATWCWWWPTSGAWRARCSGSCASTSAGRRCTEGEPPVLLGDRVPALRRGRRRRRPVAAHHPFTMPHPDDLELLGVRPAWRCGPRPTTWS